MTELWDVLDKNRRKTGRTHRRGEPLQNGDYHLVVFAWLKGSDGKYLISRRSEHKSCAHMWETVGGAALTGESSEEAVVREVVEEVGLCCDSMNGFLLARTRHDENDSGWFGDYWFFEGDIKIEDVVCQEEEVAEVKWATREEILAIIADGQFMHGTKHLKHLFNTNLL